METKIYFPTDKFGNCNYIKVELYYSLGGLNYWTYKNDRRGLYILVQPVERARGFEGFTAFSGFRVCVKEMSRKSDKAQFALWEKIKDRMEEAARIFEDGKSQESADFLCNICE